MRISVGKTFNDAKHRKKSEVGHHFGCWRYGCGNSWCKSKHHFVAVNQQSGIIRTR